MGTDDPIKLGLAEKSKNLASLLAEFLFYTAPGGIGFHIRTIFFAVEDIVRGVMNDERAKFRSLFADDPGCDGIDRMRVGFVALSFVHRSVGGGIEDDIRPNLANSSPQGLGIGEVASRTVESGDLAERSERALKLKADLAIAAGKEDFMHYDKLSYLSRFDSSNCSLSEARLASLRRKFGPN